MTTLTLPFVAETRPAAAAPSIFKAWTSSFLIHFYPAKVGRLWLHVSLLKAAFVAACNLALAMLWFIFLAACATAWHDSLLRINHAPAGKYIAHPIRAFLALIPTIPESFLAEFSKLGLLEKSSAVAGASLLLAAAVTITFFLLLPFAARPGQNQACVKHVLRTVFLGTGFIHVWAPGLGAVFLISIAARAAPFFDVILGPLVLTLSALTLWTFFSLLAAARNDYRRPADFPPPRDPTCDFCGYDLIASDPAGRCPECGRPVQESLGPGTRLPHGWELRPSPWNVRATKNQLAGLVKQPLKLFLAMPTLTGHRAAHRWLLLSLLAIALAASLIPLAIFFLLYRDVGFSLDVIWSAIIVGLAWAILALMMVGIETAGIATFSRMKGRPVFLAAAAKVTAYSSPLMLLWVLLGGLQILLTLYAWDHQLYRPYSLRTQQICLAVTLSLAHIGGLLWYELTVYRGIRAVQFANR